METISLPDSRRLRIVLPDRYHDSDRRYPTVYVFDERWALGIVADTVTMMSMAREIPKCIVVGIGYDDERLGALTELRARDYTITSEPAPAFTNVKGSFPTGGAPDTRDRLIDEIVPLIEQRYRTDPTDRVLVGHSFGGLCALFVFLTRPGVFSRYLLASPSIWWDDRAAESLALAPAKREDATRLFVAAGERETDEPATVRANAARFASRARGAGYDATFRTLEEETHFSSIGPAVSRGLRWLFRRRDEHGTMTELVRTPSPN